MSPRYREASVAQKRQLLDDFTHLTGYHRTYAMWLLKHVKGEQQTAKRLSRRVYGSDVEDALVQVWEQTNCLCSKRLIPFLPTALEAMERHGHLHLTAECRAQLLGLSAAIADRILHPHRQRVLCGLSTTRAGTLLKQNIPLRTFEQWDEQVPGFVEADLVAHCDSSVEGTYLFTLTMTDIATGWTECLPVRTKSAEAVLAAVKQARSLFPFPLLGLDTDNGTEFINDLLVAYCEAEKITFTRGRPALKNDQCYVEQKNGHIVRQVVGYARFGGEQAHHFLGELYRLLSLYVNYFQPSMKLCAVLKEGRKMQRIYDEAKTPFQRLLHAEVFSTERVHALTTQFEGLDMVRLLKQIKQAQRVLFRYATSSPPQREEQRRLVLGERFRVMGKQRVSWTHAMESRGTAAAKEAASILDVVLAWHRTGNDPFAGEWERIAEWVCAHPTRSCRAIFEELYRLSADRYQPSHLRTLQRGVQKIRARLALMDVQHTELSISAGREKREQQDMSSTEVLSAEAAEEQKQYSEVNGQKGCALAGSEIENLIEEESGSCWAEEPQECVSGDATVECAAVQDEHLADACTQAVIGEALTLQVQPSVPLRVDEGI